MRVLVETGDQTESARFVQASTTTELLAAHEITKPNVLFCTPKLGPLFRITGFGSDNTAVKMAAKRESQPLAPGK